MTREEIRTQCLRLPEAERAALAEQLVDSLHETERLEAIRDHIDDLEASRLEARREKLEAEMASWFEGESVEMTDERWEELMHRARTEDRSDKPYGVGVPAEWTGKTPREHQEALKRKQR